VRDGAIGDGGGLAAVLAGAWVRFERLSLGG
jgi:hypothetical protein